MFVVNWFQWHKKFQHPLEVYCEQSPKKQLCSFNQIYSMMLFIKSSEYIYGEIQQVKTYWGEREREREQQINGVRDRALVRNGNGMGWKWPLVKKDT